MNILYVNACVRKNSRTNELSEYVLSKLQGNVQEILEKAKKDIDEIAII